MEATTTAAPAQFKDIQITADPDVVSKLYGIDKAQQKRINEFFVRAQDPDEKPSLEGELMAMIEKYPGNPIFRNFLGTWLENIGEQERAIALLDETIELFPDYVSATVSKANSLIIGERPEEALKYLGDELRIGDRFKPRKTFHIREVELFEASCVTYLITMERVEEAMLRLSDLRTISENEELLQAIGIQVLGAALEAGIPVPLPPDEHLELVNRHPGIDDLELAEPSVRWLFMHDHRMPISKLKYILKQDKETLISDLAQVLDHGVEHFEAYQRMGREDDLLWSDTGFMMHAMMLLGELPSRKSLQAVLSILARDEVFLEFFYNDLYTEDLWEPVAKLADGQLDLLEQFMLSPVPRETSKMLVAEAILVYAGHQPAALPEVEQWHGRLLDKAVGDDDAFGRDLVDILVMHVADLRLKGLMPVIERLHDLDRFNTFEVGTLEHLRKVMGEPLHPYHMKILPFEERYAELAELEDMLEKQFYREEDEEDPGTFYTPPVAPYQRPEPKVGRNDPCPCGSGKKYKKCCLAV